MTMSPPLDDAHSRRRRLWAFAWVALVAMAPAVAQSWEDRRERGVLALEQAVRDARSDVQALLVASHPDDRYVMLAAWLRYRHGFRVSALLATRGEGGQNAWGPETGADLARIRTQESEACAARLGIDLHYLNAPDRGFSRTAAETLEQWNRRRTIEDMATIIRRVKPDLVLTTHHGRETHGHDLALLSLIPSAVELAADPSFDADGAAPFVVDRLFHGRPPALEIADSPLVLDLDEIEPMRGQTYRRLAYDAMTIEHRSQQPYKPIVELFDPTLPLTAVPLRRGSGDDRVDEGLPTFWDLLDPPRDEIEAARRRTLERLFQTNLDQRTGPQSQLRAALDLIGALRRLLEECDPACAVRIRRRLEALQRVVVHTLALTFEVDVGGVTAAVPGEQLDVVLSLRKSRAPEAPTVDITALRFEALGGCRLEVYGGTEQGAEALTEQSAYIARGAVQIPAAWSAPDSPIASLYRASQFVPPVRIRCSLNVGGQELALEYALPVEVLPPVTLESIPSRILIPADRTSADFRVRIRRNTRQPVETRLEIEAPPGFVVLGQPVPISMAPVEPEKLVTNLSLRVPADFDAPVRVILAGLSDQVLRIPVHQVDVRVDPSLRVGLVPGQDDTTKTVLKSLLGDGLRLIDQDFVLEEDLSVFDCIVVDVRAGPSIRGAFHRLLDFARGRSKRLVVFHHKPGEFNFEEAGYVGYPFAPFRLGSGRVTQEDAPVQVLAPAHPLLNRPNRIASEDWDGWVHERGLYFPAEFGTDDYTPLLAMADQGTTAPAERGSLLYARCGEGEFVYCALSLYRQLKNLHPGAVRLLANLISPDVGP